MTMIDNYMDEHKKIRDASGRTQKAGGIVIHKKGAETFVLLVHRMQHGDWAFPKGHVDAGETPEAAAMREIKEECGVSTSVTSTLPAIEYGTSTNPPEQVTCHMFLMQPQSTELGGETEEEPAWITKDKVVDILTHKNLKDYFKTILPLI